MSDDPVNNLRPSLRRLVGIWFALGLVGGFVAFGFEWYLFRLDEYRHIAADRMSQISVKGVVLFVSAPQQIAHNVAQYLFFSTFVLIVGLKSLELFLDWRSRHRNDGRRT